MDGCRQLRLREEEKMRVSQASGASRTYRFRTRIQCAGHELVAAIKSPPFYLLLPLSLSLPGCLLDIDPLSSSSSARISSQTSIDPGSSAVLSLRVIGGSEVEWSGGVW
jgi:hypothetical protein